MIVSLPKSTNALESPVRSPSGPHRKPKADLFTVLLAIALVAVLVAILFLWLEVKAYDYKSTGAPRVATVERRVGACTHARIVGACKHALYATCESVNGSSVVSS